MADGEVTPADVRKIRVFLVDDHEVVQRGLRDLLETERDIEVVGESGSALQAIRRIPRYARMSPWWTCSSPTARASRSVAMAIGVLLVVLISLIPVAGGWLEALLAIVGLGGLLLVLLPGVTSVLDGYQAVGSLR